MVHVVVVGTGRLGSAIAYSLAFEYYVDRITLVDIIPNLAKVIREDIYHGLSLHGIDLDIYSYENCGKVEDADIIIVTAGSPRKPGMSRRDLVHKNSKILKSIVGDLVDKNEGAFYIIVTNPVDPLAMYANKIVGGRGMVIGTGTILESSRFRYILSRRLGAPLHAIEAYVGGEHGEDAVLLWSMTRVQGMHIEKYLAQFGRSIDKSEIEEYIKSISMEIIKTQGATIWGPAATFIQIVRAISLNTGRILSIATPKRFEDIPEEVYVSIPTKVGKSIGPDLWDYLSDEEKEGIIKAAHIIYNIYRNIQANKP